MSETNLKFRKKPVVIEAMQWDGSDESAAAISAHFDVDAERLVFGNGVLDVVTLEGGLSASPGDWIVRGVQGELYPCKPDSFEATYEPADVRAVPQESEWRPIETAPRDGRRVLLWDGEEVTLGRWERDFEYVFDEELDDVVSRAAWTDDTVVSFGYEELAEIHPVRWMPRPPPPEGEPR